MCLLTYLPEGIQPNTVALTRGAKFNDDGHGFAIVIPRYGKHGRILVRKSMKAAKLINEFAMLREVYPDGPALFHSRITTDGVTDLFNCHPFMLSGDKRTVIGHNGILPKSVRPDKGDPRSDTRIFAQEVAGKFALHTQLGRTLAGEWMGSFNKIVVLSVDPTFDQYGYIVNEDEGIWDEGIWYSNSSFRGYRTYSPGSWTGTGYGDTVGDWEWCLTGCGAQAATVNPYSLICTRCRTCSVCLDCPCQCYLVSEKTTGKGQSGALVAKGASAAVSPVTVIGPKSITTSDASSSATTNVDDEHAAYWQALTDVAAEEARSATRSASYDYGDDDVDVPTKEQLAEVLALVGIMNSGGEIDVDADAGDWPPDDQDLSTPDYLIHNGIKYAVE